MLKLKKANFIAIKILFFQKNSDINNTLISINSSSGERNITILSVTQINLKSNYSL